MDLNMLVDLTFLLAPAPPTQPPLKSILKRKREVIISSDNDDTSDLNDGEKDLPGGGDYRQGNRQLKRRGNPGGVQISEERVILLGAYDYNT
jgi:hypothetical protein